MSIRINIENILKSPEETFQDIIKRVIDRSIADATREIELKKGELDTILFDAINLVLSDLNNEEGYISRLLYQIFKFEIKKNVRREQLIILGSQLKAQQIDLKKDSHRVEIYIDNILSTLKNLKRLQKAFEDKNMFLFDQEILKKSQSYITRIGSKIRELEQYHSLLRNRREQLQSNDKEYHALFKRIPRYHELREETYLRIR